MGPEDCPADDVQDADEFKDYFAVRESFTEWAREHGWSEAKIRETLSEAQFDHAWTAYQHAWKARSAELTRLKSLADAAREYREVFPLASDLFDRIKGSRNYGDKFDVIYNEYMEADKKCQAAKSALLRLALEGE